MRDRTKLLAFVFATLISTGCGNSHSDPALATSNSSALPTSTSEGASQTSSGLTKTLESVLFQLQGVYLFPDAIPEDISEFETVEMLIEALDDPFSLVIDEFTNTIDAFFGEFRGIGVQIQQIDDVTFFPVVFPGQPAAVAGVQVNDILLGIDSEWVEGKTIPEIVEMLQRDVGEPVHLRIQRDDAIITVSPIFSEFQRSSVFTTAITNQIAYVGVFTFLQRSSHPDGTDGEISDFLLRDVSPVIIMDFRNNLGGTLEDSIQTADLFVESGTLIELFDLNRTDTRIALAGHPGEGRTVILLQNGLSASASEIVIASLRDNLGSRIIGTQSFGKAVSQSFFRFIDDPGGLQLVTGGIRSPSGEDYNKVGITPDQVVEFEFDSETFSDTQLDAAITFARSLPGIESDQPVMPFALEKIKAFQQGINTDGSPILLEPFEQ
ncbi:MAG TPA: hypothetical protein EYN60_04915 [Nitrospirales bacterium]|nr:hypothetical protein [Nitrospirales bacterium]HIB53584.1 hypothetical protein [Nitrospirales bacterium]HIC03950.1 hypothetical protein [Nitrospirales bacterium]HIN33306.1 hypothetical protein [Nitrospirales bacterium]HIO69050.1 hypothetical protein [Nitrospirales bacterium]